MLEKQLERALILNPALKDEINPSTLARADPAEQIDENTNQMAQLFNESPLLKSYEQIIYQYESELDKKSKIIQGFERD